MGSPATNDVITMRDAWVAGSSTGNDAFIPEMFKGDSIKIALGSPTPDGSFHYSRIDNDPGPKQIKIKDGVSAAAASGNAVTVISGNVSR